MYLNHFQFSLEFSKKILLYLVFRNELFWKIRSLFLSVSSFLF